MCICVISNKHTLLYILSKALLKLPKVLIFLNLKAVNMKSMVGHVAIPPASRASILIIVAFVFIIAMEAYLQMSSSSSGHLASRRRRTPSPSDLSSEDDSSANNPNRTATSLDGISVASAEAAMQQAGITQQAAQASLEWIAKYKDTYEKAMQKMIAAPPPSPCHGFTQDALKNCLRRQSQREYRARQREQQMGYGREAYAQYARASQFAASADVEGMKFVSELRQREAERGHGTYRVMPTLVRDKRGHLQPGLAATRFQPGSEDHVARTGFTWHKGDAGLVSKLGRSYAQSDGVKPDMRRGSVVHSKLKPWQLTGPMYGNQHVGRRRRHLLRASTQER